MKRKVARPRATQAVPPVAPSLTPQKRESKLSRNLLLGASAVVGIGLVAYLIYKNIPREVSLTIQRGTGGQICVADDCIASQFTYNNGDLVKLTAIPSEGYYLGEWKVNGVSKGNASPFYIYMFDSYTITHEFSTTPPPPPPQNPVTQILNQSIPIAPTVKQRYHGYWFWINSEEEFRVIPVTDYSLFEPAYSEATLIVQALDVYSAPVPYARLLVYSTPESDSNKGTIYIGGTRAHGTSAHPAIEIVTNQNGLATITISYRHLNLNGFSQERCYNARWYIGRITPWVECLSVGERLPACNVLLNGCTGEENGVSFNAPCPNATVFGPDYEYESIQIPHALFVSSKDNPAVSIPIASYCYFGIKNTG